MKRQINMHMRVDEAWKNELSAGVDDFRRAVGLQVRADRSDRFVFNINVRDKIIGGRDDSSRFRLTAPLMIS